MDFELFLVALRSEGDADLVCPIPEEPALLGADGWPIRKSFAKSVAHFDGRKSRLSIDAKKGKSIALVVITAVCLAAGIWLVTNWRRGKLKQKEQDDLKDSLAKERYNSSSIRDSGSNSSDETTKRNDQSRMPTSPGGVMKKPIISPPHMGLIDPEACRRPRALSSPSTAPLEHEANLPQGGDQLVQINQEPQLQMPSMPSGVTPTPSGGTEIPGSTKSPGSSIELTSAMPPSATNLNMSQPSLTATIAINPTPTTQQTPEDSQETPEDSQETPKNSQETPSGPVRFEYAPDGWSPPHPLEGAQSHPKQLDNQFDPAEFFVGDPHMRRLVIELLMGFEVIVPNDNSTHLPAGTYSLQEGLGYDPKEGMLLYISYPGGRSVDKRLTMLTRILGTKPFEDISFGGLPTYLAPEGLQVGSRGKTFTIFAPGDLSKEAYLEILKAKDEGMDSFRNLVLNQNSEIDVTKGMRELLPRLYWDGVEKSKPRHFCEPYRSIYNTFIKKEMPAGVLLELHFGRHENCDSGLIEGKPLREMEVDGVGPCLSLNDEPFLKEYYQDCYPLNDSRVWQMVDLQSLCTFLSQDHVQLGEVGTSGNLGVTAPFEWAWNEETRESCPVLKLIHCGWQDAKTSDLKTPKSLVDALRANGKNWGMAYTDGCYKNPAKSIPKKDVEALLLKAIHLPSS